MVSAGLFCARVILFDASTRMRDEKPIRCDRSERS